MGIVYEAHDPEIDRKVAIKLVRADLLEGREREDYIQRFRHEAQAAGRCVHPCIVAVFDFALHQGNPYLAMEYVDGLGLDRVLAHGERFAPNAAVHLILHVLDALEAAHAVKIVHRDIKPANILLMSGGRVKVTDFGIARIESSELTHDGMAIGTPSYMSPEQCLGGPIDLRSDLFSTATLLQEMLIGQRPFPGRNLTEITRALMERPPQGGSDLESVAGAALRAVIHRALARRPEDRYPSAALMAQALREAILADSHSVEPTVSIDRTVLAVRARDAAAPQSAATQSFDPELLSSIERRLAQRVGPIARYLVQTTMRRAATVQELCEALSQRIERPEDRRQFLAEVQQGTGAGSSMGRSGSASRSARLASPVTEAEIERCRRALAETMGPIARVLVQRALTDAKTAQDLWDRVAVHISAESARAAFLNRRGRT